MRLTIVVTLLLILMAGMPLSAGISIIYNPDPSAVISTAGLDTIAQYFDDTIEKFGPSIAESFAMANLAGYPMSSSSLGSFPSFLVGVSMNLGVSYVEGVRSPLPETLGSEDLAPVYAPNPVLYVGFGLFKGLDVIGKLMIFNTDIYTPPIDSDYAKLKKLGLYSIGGKVRYNYIKKKTLLPGMLSWGGLTFSLGFDLMRGVIGLEGEYQYAIGSVDTGAGAVTFNYDGSYSARVDWTIFAISAGAITYFNVFSIFGFYTGVGLALTYGSFQFDLDVDGSISTDDAAFNALPGPDSFSAVIDGSNKFTPGIYIPLYIIGVELDLFAVKLALESMVNMRNRRDINLQLGIRIQL